MQLLSKKIIYIKIAILFFVIIPNFYTVYSQNSDAYQLQATLNSDLPSNSAENFGISVAIDGDTAIVGAENQRVGTNAAQGAAYIYVRSGSTWSLQQMLTASDGIDRDKFGAEVALEGDTAFVTRYNPTTTGRGDGKIYVFKRTGTTWTQTQTIVSNDLAAGDAFGSAMAIENGTLIAGAFNKGFLGAAYIFTSNGETWTQQAKLVGENPTIFDGFGSSVDISGDAVIIGTPGNAFGAEQGRGFAYIFTRSGTAWTQQQKLISIDRAAGDSFGIDVAISGHTAAVGASEKESQKGAVYIFTSDGGTWTERTKITHPLTSQLNRFGLSVALEGQTLAVAVPRLETQPTPTRVVIVYTGSGATWNQNDVLEVSGSYCVDIDNNSIISGQQSFGSSSNGAVYVHATAPMIGISGRVFSASGLPLRNVTVSIFDSQNVRQRATTSSFGLYSFDGVRTGETYILSVSSKRYRFASKILQFTSSVTNLDFTGIE